MCSSSDRGGRPGRGTLVQVTPAACRSPIRSTTSCTLETAGVAPSTGLWSGVIRVGTGDSQMSKLASRSANPGTRRASSMNIGNSLGESSQGPLPPCEPAGAQPSPTRAARRRAAIELPPIHSGGWGFWTGFGSNTTSRTSTNSPWNSGWSAVHRSFMTSMYSSVTRPLR